jgi:vacuolar-type H+-ATPase subunit E/Vma4
MARMIGDLDGLLTTIQHIARGEAHRIGAEAQQQADDILKQADDETERSRRQILDHAHAQAEAESRRRLAQAVEDAKREYLGVREELLERVWQQAEQRLRSLPGDPDAYAAVLRRLAWVGVNVLGPGEFTLAADPAGHKLLTADRLQAWAADASEAFGAPVSFERSAQSLDAWGGLLIARKDTRRQVDATFATRLVLAHDEIRDAVFEHMVRVS